MSSVFTPILFIFKNGDNIIVCLDKTRMVVEMFYIVWSLAGIGT